MKHHDIVILPTFSRPEMLWFCLERLSACPEVRGMEIRVCVDNHDAIRIFPQRDEIAQVLARFASLPIVQVWRPQHPYQGNTFNVMEAYREAYETDCEFVYLIEDDVAVSPDFFAWHKTAQASGHCFCSIAWKCLHGQVMVGDFARSRFYASIGVCFRRQELAFIVRHSNSEYYANMNTYLRKVFPDRGDAYTEQDGLIERLMQVHHKEAVFASTPKCAHIGWYGYHRENCPRPAGSLQERYEIVKAVAENPEKMKAFSRGVVDVDSVEGIMVSQ